MGLDELYEWKERLMKELREVFREQVLNIDVIEKVTHSMASICKMIKMEEEKEDGQMYGRMPMPPIYYDNGMNGNQMGGTYAARGRGSNASRDSRGRYTTGSTVDELYSLMNSTTDERVRQSLQRSINDIEGR